MRDICDKRFTHLPKCFPHGERKDLLSNFLGKRRVENPMNRNFVCLCAADGGGVASVAHEQLEAKTGRNVVSPLSAKRFPNVVFENLQ